MPDPKEHIKKLNEIMPKVPNMKWGALTNTYPTNAKINQLNKMLPTIKNGIVSLRKKTKFTLMVLQLEENQQTLLHNFFITVLIFD